VANAVTNTAAGHSVRTPAERYCVSDAVTGKTSSIVVRPSRNPGEPAGGRLDARPGGIEDLPWLRLAMPD
jgi:hypothetical protein